MKTMTIRNIPDEVAVVLKSMADQSDASVNTTIVRLLSDKVLPRRRKRTVNDFSKYPVTIYNKAVQTIITYVIPFAFTAYFPASYFLTGKIPLFCIGGTVIAGTVMFTLAVFVWNRGLRAYESAGS